MPRQSENSLERKIDRLVGQRMKLRRQLLQISQGKLAEDLGVSFQQVQKNEKGANRIGSGRLYRMASILKVPVSYFFEGEDLGLLVPRDDEKPEVSLDLEVLSRQDIKLLRAFSRIEDPKTRRSIAALVYQMADAENDSEA